MKPEINKKPAAAEEAKEQVVASAYKILTLIRLCGFAAEARRTLTEIDRAGEIDPNLANGLSLLVDAKNQWHHHDDNLGLMLMEIGFKIEELIDLASSLEV